MAFKGLEDRFAASMQQIYGEFSTHDGSPTQPFIEVKPTDPRGKNRVNDTYTLPIGSVKMDATRIGTFLKSYDGKIFLAKQALLQTGNSISETRVINPLFVIANVVPFIHLSRALNSPSDFPITDPTASPPSLDPSIGYAGRMDSETSAAALARVTGQGGLSGLLGLLSISTIVATFAGAFHIGHAGAIGVNQRPELNVNGQYYSIQMWKGFQKQISTQNSFETAINSLKTGDLKGAYHAVQSAVQSVKNTVNAITGVFSNLSKGNLNDAVSSIAGPIGRDSLDNTSVNGLRYFITSDTNADRYLRNSIDSSGKGTAWFLDRQAYSISGISAVPFATAQQTFSPSDIATSGLNESDLASATVQGTGINIAGITLPDLKVATTPTADDIRNSVNSIQQNAQRSLTDDINAIRGKLNTAVSAVSVAGIDLSPLTVPFLPSDTNNPAEENMLFEDISLQSRYNDSHNDYIRQAIQSQVDAQDLYWSRSDITTSGNMGFTGGKKPGAYQNTDFNPNVRSTIGSYLHDNMNNKISYSNDGSRSKLSDTTRAVMRKNAPDSIDVFFHDYENNKIIPFRAFITGISEDIAPEVNDTRYVGRIERNVVYIGVSRTVSFQLNVHAFGSDELDIMWGKVNYLSGLCYPAAYSNGFMVPPLVKLTIGNIYKNQPGYIRGLTNSVDSDVSWEISDGHMLPHGLTINVTFAIIEKTQLSTGKSLYSFGHTVN